MTRRDHHARRVAAAGGPGEEGAAQGQSRREGDPREEPAASYFGLSSLGRGMGQVKQHGGKFTIYCHTE
jgi:hypothetical protein